MVVEQALRDVQDALPRQATCRQKCMDQENACLKRTNNKGQCGNRAKTCAAKCK